MLFQNRGAAVSKHQLLFQNSGDRILKTPVPYFETETLYFETRRLLTREANAALAIRSRATAGSFKNKPVDRAFTGSDAFGIQRLPDVRQ